MGVPAGVNGQKPSGVLVRVEAGPESAKKKPTQQSRRRTNQLCYAVIQKRK